MCISAAAAPRMPAAPPKAPTMADPSVMAARNTEQDRAAAASGLAGTQLTENLGGQGKGVKKLAGAQ